MTTSTPRKRGGQPKPPEARKRGNLTFRVRDDLRLRLEESATKCGRSVSEEIEQRLEQSFNAPDLIDKAIDQTLKGLFGGSYTLELTQRIALALRHTETITNASWNEDKFTCWEGKQAVISILDAVMTAERPSEQEYRDRGNFVPFGKSLGAADQKQEHLPKATAVRPSPEKVAK